MDQYHEFLQLGYISSLKDTQDFKFRFDSSLVNLSETELILKGKELLVNEVEKQIKKNDELLIPISGGLDSRLILSAVSECRSLSKINTLTYGTKGTLDYEIGNEIAFKMDTKHTKINLMEHTFKLEDLYQFAKNVDRPTILFHNIPYSELNQKNFDLLISGFLGDVASGKRFNAIDTNKNNKEVNEEYFKSMFQRQNFKVENNELLKKLVNSPLNNSAENLTYKEMIYIKEHNLKININQVYAAFNDIDIYTPFYNTEFMNYLISLPKEFRSNQNLYKKLIFEYMNPNLANMRVKNFYGTSYKTGSGIRRIIRSKNALIHRLSKKVESINSPYVNFVDFRKKIMIDSDFKNLIIDLLKSLKSRKLSLYENEVDKAIYKIEKNIIDNSYNFLLLASLEIYIRLGKINESIS